MEAPEKRLRTNSPLLKFKVVGREKKMGEKIDRVDMETRLITYKRYSHDCTSVKYFSAIFLFSAQKICAQLTLFFATFPDF